MTEDRYITFSPPRWLGRFLFWILPAKIKASLAEQSKFDGTANRTFLGGSIGLSAVVRKEENSD